MDKAYVLLFDDMSTLDNDFAANNLHRLPVFRRNQCERYRQIDDRNACILSYILLEKGLWEQYGITYPVEFIYNGYGKPYLRDFPYIFFNLSHCRRGVVCTLADYEIGIDIQEVRPFDIDLARRVCSENEFRLFGESKNPARLFCRIWTKKESYAKARGMGIAEVLKRDLSGIRFAEWENKKCCIALSGRNDSILTEVEFRRVYKNDLAIRKNNIMHDTER